MNQANNKRIIILDTETTGMNKASGKIYEGHRIIEIGAVEMINRRLTGKTFHVYINPEQEIDPEAIKVHGITNEQVANEPVFAAIQDDFINFIKGAELVAHNASFDMSFIDHEFNLNKANTQVDQICTVTDSLAIAKKMFPSKKNNLDALCRRFEIDNSHRTLHGALLDAEILADVYILLTGEQETLTLTPATQTKKQNLNIKINRTKVIKANAEEIKNHNQVIQDISQDKNYYW